MTTNLHPNTQAMREKLTPEQCEKILNTEYTASDIKSQMERLEEIKNQLRKPGEKTIEGYVAVDEWGMGGCFLHSTEPEAVAREFCDTGEYEVYWISEGDKYELDSKLFPDMTPESEPKKYRITITPIE